MGLGRQPGLVQVQQAGQRLAGQGKMRKQETMMMRQGLGRTTSLWRSRQQAAAAAGGGRLVAGGRRKGGQLAGQLVGGVGKARVGQQVGRHSSRCKVEWVGREGLGNRQEERARCVGGAEFYGMCCCWFKAAYVCWVPCFSEGALRLEVPHVAVVTAPDKGQLCGFSHANTYTSRRTGADPPQRA